MIVLRRECGRAVILSPLVCYPFSGVQVRDLGLLRSGVAVAQFTSNTPRRVVGQWGGAGGASCEDHFVLAGSVRVAAAACKREKPVLLLLLFLPRAARIVV